MSGDLQRLLRAKHIQEVEDELKKPGWYGM